MDENEKFFIDGETNASVEFQGLEDSFGFSWGFPPTENLFPLTGYFPFNQRGGAAYRFFVQDAINFQKSLKVAIAFGDTENGWRKQYSQPIKALQFSSTVYWYQIGKRAPLPPLPSASDRVPAAKRQFWPPGMQFLSAEDFQTNGGKLLVCCGLSGCETMCEQPGYSVMIDPEADAWTGWEGDVFYCRSAPRHFDLELNLPKEARGILRLYIIDPDNFQGGRKETIIVAGEPVGTFDHFHEGRWIEVPIGPDKTADGKVRVQVVNARDGANAVLSKLEWRESK